MDDRNSTQGSTVDKMERILKLDMTLLSRTEMTVESSLVKWDKIIMNSCEDITWKAKQ